MVNKAEYVKRQPQLRSHHCHWPGCTITVPPAMWGCSKHWFTLPIGLRNEIWAAYVPGQEIKGTPSEKYVEVAKKVQAWIKEREAAKQGESK